MYKIVKRAILLSFLTSLLAVHGSQKAIAQIVKLYNNDLRYNI